MCDERLTIWFISYIIKTRLFHLYYIKHVCEFCYGLQKTKILVAQVRKEPEISVIVEYDLKLEVASTNRSSFKMKLIWTKIHPYFNFMRRVGTFI